MKINQSEKKRTKTNTKHTKVIKTKSQKFSLEQLALNIANLENASELIEGDNEDSFLGVILSNLSESILYGSRGINL
ncbi:TPA: hypothetical protein ACN1ND_000290 [Enterococcus faecalis]|nr:hypothetical protein [Enterococcus faecalis]EKQ3613476.1 hypothetical protein [Enterococcus faecalis]